MIERFQFADDFVNRHVGSSQEEQAEMLRKIGADSLKTLVDQTIPASIRLSKDFELPERMNEYRYQRHIQALADQNRVFRTYIGMGYYNTITPATIQRNIFENPGWYTSYTPYQAEISQGRLEALLNFQTMVSDLTGFEIANASLLDEATAAAEAMGMFFGKANRNPKKPEKTKFFVDQNAFPQTKAVLETRAIPMGIELVIGEASDIEFGPDYFGALLQYPAANGIINNPEAIINKAKEAGVLVAMAADILALTLLKNPAELGADVAVGSTQRFGVPLGYGGPHAAYFACKDDFKRLVPGRIIGVSVDAEGRNAVRMALQTREQHIRREKATSNICTAQALLAIMAGMYAVYHGPEGLRNIATRINFMTFALVKELEKLGYAIANKTYFDTITVHVDNTKALRQIAEQHEINFWYYDNGEVGISLDETLGTEDLQEILDVFAEAAGKPNPTLNFSALSNDYQSTWPSELGRTSEYLTHPIFHLYRSETELMRYMKKLENRDISLTYSMIPLGSCTMKLNAATQLMPVSWTEFNSIHPFVPADQVKGYTQIISDLEDYLNHMTGFTACSLQPNSGAQGEFTGLLVIRAYHHDRGDTQRNVTLIPSSAHGTNPASAVMAGQEVVVVKCDDMGNIDVADLREKAEAHKDRLAALMVTYPSTHGVFEQEIQEVCDIIHENGGLVYMDGANMNAQVGLTNPARIGADVCHLNLHKTFSIPHGGGGPGMGPICVNDKLAPYLPGHPIVKTGGKKAIPAVSATPYGSSSILLISYAYIRLLGREGATQSTEVAMLNANYLKAKLADHYPILYTGKNGRVGHEFIIDLRGFKHSVGIEVEDVAKRLIDYGFHAPTVSFPVPGTMMIEPTESESKAELDRFCDAMISIREEMREIEQGLADPNNNVLKHAPHTSRVLSTENWDRPYSREKAVFPLPYLHDAKYWPPVSRINNPYGDRNLICTCPPMEEYEEEATV